MTLLRVVQCLFVLLGYCSLLDRLPVGNGAGFSAMGDFLCGPTALGLGGLVHPFESSFFQVSFSVWSLSNFEAVLLWSKCIFVLR